MGRRGVTALVVAAVLVTACTGGDESDPTTAPTTGVTSAGPAEVTPTVGGDVDEDAEDTLIDTVDELEELEDVVAEAPPPETRTDELADLLADGEPPTVQQAVDLFDILYGPFPGATPTDLPPGEGLGSTYTLWAIDQVRDELAPDQLAALDAIETDAGLGEVVVEAQGDAGVVTGTSAAGGADTSTPATSTPLTSTTATSTTGTSTSGPQGLRSRQDPALIARLGNLAAQTMTDWLRYAPLIDVDVPMPTVVVRVMDRQQGTADMDAYPYRARPNTCRVRVWPNALANAPDDVTLRYAFAHELFHCVQYQWAGVRGEGLQSPSWVVEGTATFAMLDLYRSRYDPPPVYTPVPWFTRAGAPLERRTYSAWPLWEAAYQDNRNPYAAIRSMIRAGNGVAEELLAVGGLEGVLFRARWASTSTRATQQGSPEWQLEWPSTFRTGGPLDNKVDRGTRGLGSYRIVGSADYGHQTQQIAIGERVGLVVATPHRGPLTTWTATGTVVVPEGVPASFCFSPDGCACPGGRTSDAYEMDGRRMVLSLPAGRTAASAQMHAVQWNPEKHCKEEPRTDRASSNGDPHLITFDGLAFDVHAPGELVLVRDTGADDFEVQVRHEPWPLFGSGNTAVAVGVAGRRITFTADSLTTEEPPIVRVDGAVVDVGGALEVGPVVVTGDPAGAYPVWDVTWPDGTVLSLRWYLGWSVDLEVAIDRLDRVEGLLGPANDDVRDDLALADGTFLSPEEQERIDTEYVEPWFVDEDTTLFDYAPGQSPQAFRDADRPPLPPRPDDETVERCASALGPDATSAEVDACAFDVTVTGEEGFVDLHTTVVERRVAADPNPTVGVVVVEDERDAPDEPSVAASADGAALVLDGAVWDGFSLIDDPDALPALTGALELEEGTVVVGRAARCLPDVDVTLELIDRADGAGGSMRVCDGYGFNATLAPDEADVVDGESYAWVMRGGTYDVRVTTNSPSPIAMSVAVFADPDPTIVDAETGKRDGVALTLSGVADTLVVLLDTDDSGLTWAASGFDVACGSERYGPELGSPGVWDLAYCDHTGDELPIGITGELELPFIAYARTDEPVEVSLRPVR